MAASPDKGGYKLPKLPNKKADNRGLDRQAALRGKCGALKRDGVGKCSLPAGFGTEHFGIGRCRYHSGNAPNTVKNAMVLEARLMGCPIDMNPIEAIIWCIRITAGEVKWLSDQIAKLEEVDWIEDTVLEQKVHLWVRERKDAQNRLFKYSKDALSLGLAERAVKVAEMYGEAIARFMTGVLDELQLLPWQKDIAPKIVRKHLILLEAGRPVSREEMESLPKPTQIAS